MLRDIMGMVGRIVPVNIHRMHVAMVGDRRHHLRLMVEMADSNGDRLGQRSRCCEQQAHQGHQRFEPASDHDFGLAAFR
jgi:hypothetical protein